MPNSYPDNAIEIISVSGEEVAEILRSTNESNSSIFYSDPKSDLQIGILSHTSGFIEETHFHPIQPRNPTESQQFIIVIRGEISIDFFSRQGVFSNSVNLMKYDAILIKRGVHRLRALSDSKCITIKQGPFLGKSKDKVIMN